MTLKQNNKVVLLGVASPNLFTGFWTGCSAVPQNRLSGKGQIEECIFYWWEHLKSLKSPAPFSLPSCFLSDNNVFQVELPWLAAPYHTFGLGKWSLEVFVKYFLIIHKLAPDWSSLQQNAKFTPACSKSSEPCIRKLTFRDYYDLQTVATSLKWVLCGIWW